MKPLKKHASLFNLRNINMSWINFPGFRGGPAAVVHGHGPHEPNVSGEGNTNERRDINKNLIHYAELKKLKPRFYSEVLRKKFFVLYEDSRQSLTHPRDPSQSNGDLSDDENDEDYEPARLEYFNSRRSWETGEPPRRAIQIKDAFAITRKKDTRESIHKYVIAIYLVEDCLGIVFDTEQEMNTWLEMLNSCHMGGRSIDGRLPKPKYEHVYEVDVQNFEPELITNTFKMIGPYRMVVTTDAIKFFAVGTDKPITFLIKAIRKCRIPKSDPHIFKIDIGRSTESGSGTITFKSADKEISYSIRETIYAAQNSAMQNSNFNPSRRDRKKGPNSSSSSNSSSGFNNIRNRTNSWSNPRPMSANRLTAGTIGSTAGTGSAHQRQHSDAIVNSTENSASAIPTVDKRFRTTSEGNAHFDIKPRSIFIGKSVTSGGSPMSRGSFVSSESAGSSNSLDEPDMDPAARILTPNDEHNPPATIFEESSAESCIEQTTTSGGDHFRGSGRNSTNISVIPQLESRLADSMIPPTEASDINYTPIDILPSSGMTTGITSASASVIANSPPSTSTHYTTILAASMSSSSKENNSGPVSDNDYMVMSPSSSSAATSFGSSLQRNKKSNTGSTNLEAGIAAPKHKPLSGLLDEISSMSSSNVTSPNSQSSYNPLLDDNDLAGAASASSDYAIMSPASSSAGAPILPGTRSAGGNNNVNKHPTKLQVGPEEYVDMSPRGAVPIPNILNRNTSEHRIGYSPARTTTLLAASKTPSSSEADSPYLLMSPSGEHNPPDIKHKFEILSSTRTGSIDSSSTGARPKTSRTSSRNYLRSQCDSQRSSLCFEDPLEFGISPQDNSGSTLIGPASDYASLDITRELASSLDQQAIIKPIEVVSRLRLDDEEDDDDELDEAHENDLEDEEEDLGLEMNIVGHHHPAEAHHQMTGSTTVPGPPLPQHHARAYSVGHRPSAGRVGISDSNSSVSTTGSGSATHHRYNKSRFIDIPGATTASGTSGTGTGSHSSSISPGGALLTGQSPSMAARFGSWFRNRTLSDVPKSVDDPNSRRRRHRTQSEGEKDEL